MLNQKPLLAGCGVFLLFVSQAVKTEYVRVKLRIETTQAKVDKLADELAATTATVHETIKTIADKIKLSESEQAIEATEKPKVDYSPTITMHSSDSCGPCRAWLSSEKAKWEKVGWDVVVIKETTTDRGWPWYEIVERDGTKFQVTGPLTTDSFTAGKKSR